MVVDGNVTSFRISEGPFTLDVVLVSMGRDLMVCLFGGTSHMGSVAMAVPRPSLRHPDERSATASVLNVVGHKEDQLTTDVAKQLAAGLGSVVTVAAGIHYDDLDESGIESILRLGQRAVERILVVWHAAGSGVDKSEEE